MLRCLATGASAAAAEVSVVVKTLVLYTIMVTGSIWEKACSASGCSRPFFWEDVFSMLVLALHTAYLVALATRSLEHVGVDGPGAGGLRAPTSSTPRSSC